MNKHEMLETLRQCAENPSIGEGARLICASGVAEIEGLQAGTKRPMTMQELTEAAIGIHAAVAVLFDIVLPDLEEGS